MTRALAKALIAIGAALMLLGAWLLGVFEEI